MIELGWMTKTAAALGIYLFLPATAWAYLRFRQERSLRQVQRVVELLRIDPAYSEAFGERRPHRHFVWAVGYASVVAALGLSLLFFGGSLFAEGELPGIELGGASFPARGSRLVAAMAFLGAYVWGLQYVYRRFTLDDLVPSVYYGLGMRMILAAAIAMVTYNAYEALGGPESATGEGGGGSGLMASLWPSLAFFLGMFPQRGILWLAERLPIISSRADPSVRAAPLDLIEGVERHDKLRLEEVGIDSCYDLATADFVPLLLDTPYSARQLVDWILQAKLCVYLGEGVGVLRQRGIRTVVDLGRLSGGEIEELAPEVPLTRTALEQARRASAGSGEIQRLCWIGERLGVFSELEPEGPAGAPLPEPSPDP